MTKNILEIVNLKKTFNHKNGNITLFSNVNLKIRQGDLIALVGPSGSGKSSFLHLLALLDEPNAGKIFLDNKDTFNLNEKLKNEIRRRKISIIFQDNNLLADFTALENVQMPLIIRGEKKSLSLQKTTKILKEVKMLNRKNHFPSELSGGEQQRIAIARSLVADTDLILADEPTGNLDYQTSQNTTQQDLINTHGGAKRKRGGSAEGLAPLQPKTIDVPQFPQQGPIISPQGANNTSVATNTSAVSGTVNATNDCYATNSCGTKGGGKRTRRAGKRRSRRGGKRVTWGCMS